MADYDPRKPRTVFIESDTAGDYNVDENYIERKLPPEELPPSLMTPEAVASRSQGVDPSYDINKRFSERKRASDRQVDRESHIERITEQLASFFPSPDNRIDPGSVDRNRREDEVLAYPPRFDTSNYTSDELAADFVHSELGTGSGKGPLGERRLLRPGSMTNPMGYTLSLEVPDEFHEPVEPAGDWNNYRTVVGGSQNKGGLPSPSYDEYTHDNTWPGGYNNPQYKWSMIHDEDGRVITDSSGAEWSTSNDDFIDHVWDEAYGVAEEVAGATFDADTRLEKMMRQQGVNQALKASGAQNHYGNNFYINPSDVPG